MHIMNYIKDIDHWKFKPVKTNGDRIFSKVMDRIHEAELVPLVKGVAPYWKYCAIAASLSLLIISSFWLDRMFRSDPIPYIEIAAVPGAKTKITLPDSSIVWLNSNAFIRYPQEFNSEERKVEMSGEAMFIVEKDVNRPFIVSAEGVRIKVLGTSFNLHAEKDDSFVETTLLKGSVALFMEGNVTNKPDVILKPNQQAIVDKLSGRFEVETVLADSYCAWVDGRFQFKENTLEEIMRMLERAFDVKIHIENEKMKQTRLTGNFVEQETLDEILAVLQITAHYTIAKKRGEIYIKKQ